MKFGARPGFMASLQMGITQGILQSYSLIASCWLESGQSCWSPTLGVAIVPQEF